MQDPPKKVLGERAAHGRNQAHVITFPFNLAFMATLVLALIFAFVAPLGAASLPFWSAMLKKGVSGAGEEATPLELLDGPLLVPILT